MEDTTGLLSGSVPGWTAMEEIDVGHAPFLCFVRKPQDARVGWHRDRDLMDDWLGCSNDGGAALGEGRAAYDVDVGYGPSWSGNRLTTTSSAPVLDIGSNPCLACSTSGPWPQILQHPSAQDAGLHSSVQHGNQLTSFAWPFAHIACGTEPSVLLPVQVAAIAHSALYAPLPNLQTPTNLLLQAAALPVFDTSATPLLLDKSIESESDSTPTITADESIAIELDQISTETDSSISPTPFLDQSAAIRLKQALQNSKNHSPRATGVLKVCKFNDVHIE